MIPQRLKNELEEWIEHKRYGNIQINFVAGKIVNYNVTQSLRVEFNGDYVKSVTATITQPQGSDLNGSGKP